MQDWSDARRDWAEGAKAKERTDCVSVAQSADFGFRLDDRSDADLTNRPRHSALASPATAWTMNLDLHLLSLRRHVFRAWKVIRLPLGLAVAYYASAEVAFLIGTYSDNIFAPFWPPNVVLFCALVMSPRYYWWICLVAALPAHALVELRVGMAVPQMLVAFVTNCSVALVNAAGVQRFIGNPPWFQDFRNALIYVVITAVVGPGICAIGGAFVEALDDATLANYSLYWAHWYASNALGFLTLGPVALIFAGDDRGRSVLESGYRYAEAALLGLSLIAVCSFAFEFSAGRVLHAFVPALLYLPLPFILWSALRFGATGASGTILIVTVVLIWRMLNGPTLFAEGNPETNALGVQLFLIGLSAPTLLLGAAVSQVRTAWRESRESQERMIFAAASAKTGLWEYSLQTGHLWATDYCRSLFGLPSSGDITPASLLQVVHADERDAAAEIITAVKGGGEPPPVEFRIVLPEGQTRWLVARRRVQYDDQNKPTRISGVFADISDRKLSDAEAEQRRQEIAHLTRVALLGRLSGAIAHELNQPLTAILSNAQAARLMLSQKAPDLTEIGDAIDDIVTEDSRASEVILRLRGLLKKGGIRSETVDLNQLIISTNRLLHSELVARQIKLDVALAENVPAIFGDPIQMQQVLLNLVMNSIEALVSAPTAQPAIAIATCACDIGQVKITIADNGPGIAVDIRNRLFEPFFTTKEQGLGLGLSICSSIVASHGGTLDIGNSDSGGAVATLVLPVPRRSDG